MAWLGDEVFLETPFSTSQPLASTEKPGWCSRRHVLDPQFLEGWQGEEEYLALGLVP